MNPFRSIPQLGISSLTAAAILSISSTSLGAQTLDPPLATRAVFALDGGAEMRYGLSIPAGYDASESEPRPLILALHPGGRAPYYGSSFMQSIVEPALRGWEAVIVAPDVPSRNWSNRESERAVLALVEEVISTHSIDPDRILVTGFSMGGSGVWYLATRHPELFTGAIPIASRSGDNPLDGLGDMPIHLIHSPDDEVVPFDQARETVAALEELGHPVRMISLGGASHYQMGAYIAPLRVAGDWIQGQWGFGESEVSR